MGGDATAQAVVETQNDLMDALDAVGEEPMAPSASAADAPPASSEPEPAPANPPAEPQAQPTGQSQGAGDQPQPVEDGELPAEPAADPRDARIAALEALVNQLAGGNPPAAAPPDQEQQPPASTATPAAPAPAQPAQQQEAAYKPQEFMTAAEAEAEGLDAGVINTALNRLGEHLWREMSQAVQGARAAAEQVHQRVQYDAFMTDFFAKHQDLADVRSMVEHTLSGMSAEAQAKGEAYKDKLTLMTTLAGRVRKALGRPSPDTEQEIKTVDKDGKEVNQQPPAMTGLGTGRRGGPPAPQPAGAKSQAQLMAELDALEM